MYNSLQIIGNVGSDPEVRSINSTTQVCNFSVAVSDNFLDKQGQKQQRTEWFNVSAFGKLGEICAKYCVKGRQVFIQGEIRTNKWTDNQGNKRESLNLIANTMKLLGSKSTPGAGASEPAFEQNVVPNDDIPF